MIPPGTLEALVLYLVRSSALVLAAPLLGTGSSFSGYKVTLIVSIALVSYTATGAPVPADYQALDFGLWTMREVLIGLGLAFVLQAVMMAVRVSSDLIGHEMAFNMSNLVDPVSGISVPLVSQMYEMLFFLALLSVNGHHWLFRALAESYERAPIARLELQEGIPVFVVQLFAELFSAGLTFAAPILVLLLLVSVLIGLLSRAVPQLNILEFGFGLRIALGLVAMFLFAPLLAPAMEGLLGELMTGLDAGLDALEG